MADAPLRLERMQGDGPMAMADCAFPLAAGTLPVPVADTLAAAQNRGLARLDGRIYQSTNPRTFAANCHRVRKYGFDTDSQVTLTISVGAAYWGYQNGYPSPEVIPYPGTPPTMCAYSAALIGAFLAKIAGDHLLPLGSYTKPEPGVGAVVWSLVPGNVYPGGIAASPAPITPDATISPYGGIVWLLAVTYDAAGWHMSINPNPTPPATVTPASGDPDMVGAYMSSPSASATFTADSVDGATSQTFDIVIATHDRGDLSYDCYHVSITATVVVTNNACRLTANVKPDAGPLDMGACYFNGNRFVSGGTTYRVYYDTSETGPGVAASTITALGLPSAYATTVAEFPAGPGIASQPYSHGGIWNYDRQAYYNAILPAAGGMFDFTITMSDGGTAALTAADSWLHVDGSGTGHADPSPFTADMGIVDLGDWTMDANYLAHNMNQRNGHLHVNGTVDLASQVRVAQRAWMFRTGGMVPLATPDAGGSLTFQMFESGFNWVATGDRYITGLTPSSGSTGTTITFSTFNDQYADQTQYINLLTTDTPPRIILRRSLNVPACTFAWTPSDITRDASAATGMTAPFSVSNPEAPLEFAADAGITITGHDRTAVTYDLAAGSGTVAIAMTRTGAMFAINGPATFTPATAETSNAAATGSVTFIPIRGNVGMPTLACFSATVVTHFGDTSVTIGDPIAMFGSFATTDNHDGTFTLTWDIPANTSGSARYFVIVGPLGLNGPTFTMLQDS